MIYLTILPSEPNVYYGKSTEEKPTINVPNGSAWIELDTSKVYFFSLEDRSWYEFGGSDQKS